MMILKLHRDIHMHMRQVSRSIHQTLNIPTRTGSPAFILCHDSFVFWRTSSTRSSLSSLLNRTFVEVTKTSVVNIPNGEPIVQRNNGLASKIHDAATKSGVIVRNDVEQNNSMVVITASAVQQILYLSKLKRPDHPEVVYLRIYVDSGGCSGFQYKFDIEFDDRNPGIDHEQDVVITACLSHIEGQPKTRVVIDSASLEMIKGSTIDYIREMIKSSFTVINNPQSESACGCGSSFAIKNFKINPADH